MFPSPSKVALAFGSFLFLNACSTQGGYPLSAPPASAEKDSFQKSAVEKSVNQQAVAYQIDTAHTGFAKGPLRLPLQQLWPVKLPVLYRSVGFPTVANGVVVVTAYNKLIALDEKTGKKVWSHSVDYNENSWIGQAYDNGTIFASPAAAANRKSLGLFAFDEKTGKQLWAAPTGFDISSAPTAAAGIVYSSNGGEGGDLDAYDESTGSLDLDNSVRGGGDSSPAVTATGVFVSYARPQTYKFQAVTGQQLWHDGGTCEGGGGSTPVAYKGLLFAEGSPSGGNNGLILRAGSGRTLGVFNSLQTPAFAHDLGFFTTLTTLQAAAVPSMMTAWTTTVPASNFYESPPLLVGSIVYLTTSSDTLVGYDASTGKQQALIQLNKDGFTGHAGSALAFGDGELVVPDGQYLIALKGR
jgi:outer membrane protein assembly factor BamB